MVNPAMTTNTLADEEKETLNEVEGKNIINLPHFAAYGFAFLECFLSF